MFCVRNSIKIGLFKFQRTYFSCPTTTKRIYEEEMLGIKSADFSDKILKAHKITREIASNSQINFGSSVMSKALTELYDYTCIGGRYNRTKLMLHAYEKLIPPSNLTDENVMLASIVGYQTDVFVSAFLILDDLIENSDVRRNKPSWVKKVGITSAIDPILMTNATLIIFKYFFEQSPFYISLIQLFNEMNWMLASGYRLDMHTLDIFGKNEQNFSWENYKRHYFSEMSMTGFYLPIVSAMIMVGHDHQNYNDSFMKIIDSLGFYITALNDYNDHYGDSQETGKTIDEDIKMGKLTWLILTAMDSATPEQKGILKKSYGKQNEEDVEIISKIYDELLMTVKFENFKKSLISSIEKDIELLIPDKRIQEILIFALNLGKTWYKTT